MPDKIASPMETNPAPVSLIRESNLNDYSNKNVVDKDQGGRENACRLGWSFIEWEC